MLCSAQLRMLKTTFFSPSFFDFSKCASIKRINGKIVFRIDFECCYCSCVCSKYEQEKTSRIFLFSLIVKHKKKKKTMSPLYGFNFVNSNNNRNAKISFRAYLYFFCCFGFTNEMILIAKYSMKDTFFCLLIFNFFSIQIVEIDKFLFPLLM